MNRTIVERIRCMLSHAKLPKSFKGEAMKTAITMINLSPSNPRPTSQLSLMPANHWGDLQNDDNGGFLNEPLVGDLESANDDIDVIPEQVMQEAPNEP